MKSLNTYITACAVGIIFFGCKKTTFENPYDAYVTPPLYSDPTPLASLPSDNFAYLQNVIFKPTCANSGCHDGAFEPDFRTIASSYNTMVYQPVLTNDATNSFIYRVDPGSAASSLVHERLLVALPNTSGIMPPVTNSDWNNNKTSYINSIKNWINNGAKDMYGNDPTPGNPLPVVTGFHAFPDGNTSSPYSRAPGSGVTPILIPSGNVDLWFNFTDDQTAPSNFTINEIKISPFMYDDFDTVSSGVMNITSTLSANDFESNPATFTHKYDFDASIYSSGTILYVRVYVLDADNTTPLETPNKGTAKQVLYLFSLYVN